MTDSWRVYVRDTAYARVAELDIYARLTVVLRWNDGGVWSLEGVPADHPALDALSFVDGGQGVAGIILERNGTVVMSGPMQARTDRDGEDGAVVDLSGTDDTARLAHVLAMPDPSGMTYTTYSHDVRTAAAETLLHQYVAVNAGPSAVAARRMPGLAMGTNSGSGTSMTKRARFRNLMELLQEIAATDYLRFQVRQSASAVSIEFLTSESRDRSASVFFGRAWGNVTEVLQADQAATANYIYVGGGGEGTARTIAERGDTSSLNRYGRREVFLDQRQTTDSTELGQAMAEELERSKGGRSFDFTAVDTVGITYGEDYELGDRVTVVLNDSTTVALVTAITIDLDENGVTYAPEVSALAVARRGGQTLRSATQRLSNLERNAEGFTIGMIMMWARAASLIPSGWQLCNGTAGTPDLRGRFVKGASVDGDLGTTGGQATINLSHSHSHSHTIGHTHSHSHTIAHDHNHSHTISHNHQHSHTIAHDHAHAHSGAVHTHSHAHTSAAHSHSHAHSGDAHTHNHSHTIAHMHSHSHTSAAHSHSHNHGGSVSTAQTLQTIFNATDGGLYLPAPGSGTLTLTVSTDATSTTPGSTGTDATGVSSANSGSDASAASAANTGTDATSTTPANTGTDASAASAANTGTDSTGSSAANSGLDSTGSSSATSGADNTGASSANSGLDATGASSANSGTDATASGGVTNIEPPYTYLYYIERVA